MTEPNEPNDIKVCIVTRTYAPDKGGVETYAEQLRSALTSQNISTRIVTASQSTSPDNEDSSKRVTRVRNILEYAANRNPSEIKIFVGIWASALLIETTKRKNVILTHHNAYQAKSGWRIYIGALKRFCAKYYINIFVSKYLRGKFGIRGIVLPNTFGQDFEAQRKINVTNNTLRIAFVGRLVEDKGCRIAIETSRLLAQRGLNNNLTIIGDGPERKKLETYAREAPNRNSAHTRIEFLGWQSESEIADKLRETDVLLIPSIWDEPFGIVALEGLASGCIVVSSNRGGLPEACGTGAIVVDPTAEKFSDAVAEAINRPPEKIQEENEKKNHHLRKHHPKRFAQRYMKVLRFVAKQGASK